MNFDEKAEINETIRVVNDVILRLNKAYKDLNADDMAQAMKAILNVKGKLVRLSSVKLDVHKSAPGAW